MANRRIKSDMSIQGIILAMGGGNPGALTACMEILSKGGQVDPDAFDGGFGNLLMLDTLGIYEERIYMLWRYVCKCDVGKMIAVLRAYQLGQLAGVTAEAINHAIDNRGAGIDLDAVVAEVKSRLPNFNSDPEAKQAPLPPQRFRDRVREVWGLICPNVREWFYQIRERVTR